MKFPCLHVTLVLGMLLQGAGCHDIRSPDAHMPAEGEELPIIDKFAGPHSKETLAMQVVVRDAATLAQIPLTDVQVNFANQMLLIVTLGRVTSDQFSVDIARVWREGGHLRVETVVHQPPPDSPPALGSPYCIAVVPRCDLNVAEFSPDIPRRARAWQSGTPPDLSAKGRKEEHKQQKPPKRSTGR